MSQEKKQEIQFPCQWEFRLVTEAATLTDSRSEVEAIGQSENAGFSITAGENSKSGKYAAIRVACEVDSLERARELAKRLSTVKGVRFLI